MYWSSGLSNFKSRLHPKDVLFPGSVLLENPLPRQPILSEIFMFSRLFSSDDVAKHPKGKHGVDFLTTERPGMSLPIYGQDPSILSLSLFLAQWNSSEPPKVELTGPYVVFIVDNDRDRISCSRSLCMLCGWKIVSLSITSCSRVHFQNPEFTCEERRLTIISQSSS